MQRLPKLTYVFWLFVKILVSIVTFLVAVETRDLALVDLNFLTFLDYGGIDVSGRSNETLALILALGCSTTQAKVFLG